jgi:transporter family-2 protein
MTARWRWRVEILLVVLALVVGAGLPVQAGINAAMGRHAGRPEWAALVNFAVGLAGLAAWLVATRAQVPAGIGRAPLWAWTGGLLGAFYVSAVVLLVPKLGVTVTLGLTVAGQMVAALVLDQAGAMGLASRPITGARVLGAALLVAAVVLIRR